MGKTLSLTRISQKQLNLLSTCPPQFQRIYLEKLATPVNPEQQEKLLWGNQFHLLMQQRELGLPIESLLAEDDRLHHSINSLVVAAPEILQQQPNSWREAEHYRALNFQNYILTVIYDLLIADRSWAQIIDWKTYLQPENKAKLAQNWQTRLYLYVLAETSQYLPEQISMTYWFVRLPTQPQKVTFNYNSTKHEQTRQDLTRYLNLLDRYFDDYYDRGIPFPHLPNCHESCPFSKYFSTPEETLTNQDISIHQDWLTSISEIEI